MKRTKVIATYGPAISSQGRLSQVVAAGVNIIRVNCSHGTTPDFVRAANSIRNATKKERFPVGLLFDISGPKLRLERFDGKVVVKLDQKLNLTTGRTELDKKTIAVNHPGIIRSIKKGQKVYIDDGNLIFEALSSGDRWVTLKAVNGGTILPGKGINLPQSDIRIPTISDKDKDDIKTAIRLKADYVALSFVRSAADVLEARRIIESFGGDQQIIAKLEKKEAIDNLDKILEVADGVMIARGDLGVELPLAELPDLQKKIIRAANFRHKAVIVATQMLESMRFAPRPTRAEVNDVASAVYDGVDAVMLSAETATGNYPVESVRTMEQIITATEKTAQPLKIEVGRYKVSLEITEAIAKAVSAHDGGCSTKLIFAFTTSGFTAAMISNLFPPQLVIALTPDPRVLTKLVLLRSVYPVQIEQPRSFDDMLDTVNDVARKYRLTQAGDKVVITGGVPFGSTVPTNFMMYHEMGKKQKHGRRSK
ncbi:MAG: pyruvate kinase [Candidatus Zixiibacteriota bacterium]